MKRIDYLFMFLTDGCNEATHRMEIDTPGGKVTVVGVGSIDEACAAATSALAEGTAHFIELCADFGEDGCRRVIGAVDGRLPVGYVTYFPDEQTKLNQLLT